jgi:hypothetical protein
MFRILILALAVVAATIGSAKAYTFNSVQVSTYLWVIQRSDGNYLSSDGSGNKMWSTSQSIRVFAKNGADVLAYGLTNPPSSSVSFAYTRPQYTVNGTTVYGISAQQSPCPGGICPWYVLTVPKDPPDNGNWTWPPGWYDSAPFNGEAWAITDVPSQFALWSMQNKDAAAQ